MRASGVMALTITLTGFAPNAIYIIVMRFIQGSFSGYINNATALMASETPHERSGWVMSQMMTAGTAGNLVGHFLVGHFPVSLATYWAVPGATEFRSLSLVS